MLGYAPDLLATNALPSVAQEGERTEPLALWPKGFRYFGAENLNDILGGVCY